ncbi:hypothetical protein G4228_001947 [Cervus hanglu yarkandensis]|nr:hypothetical protein G4228_001947 [Cervus hanglu yarkandensis]
MKLKGSLACLLLFLLLGSGEASPLQGGEEDAGREVGESVGHGVGEALGHVVGEAVIHGVEEAIERGTGEKAGLGIREARDPHLGDALAHKLKEASHALENTGSEAGRQAENIIGHGVDPAHSSWQGTPGSNGAWGTHGQPPSRGHGIPGSQGGPGGPGDTRDHVFSGGSGGRFGANAQGGHRGPFNLGANPQNSQTSSEPFNFDTFWKNFKSKLGFINWDALNKDFKHNTPFLNWKVITEGEDVPSLQKRAGGAGQPGTGWQDAVAVTAKNYNYNQQGPPTALGGQYPAKTPAKEETTIGNYAAGPEAFNAQFLNIDKLRSALKNDEFLNWHALFESIKRKLPFLNWDAFPKLKGLRSATPDAQ